MPNRTSASDLRSKQQASYRSGISVLRSAQQTGFRTGVMSALRGGSYGVAPVRIHKTVGSPATDRAARRDDIVRVKHDVRRAERRVVDDAQ